MKLSNTIQKYRAKNIKTNRNVYGYPVILDKEIVLVPETLRLSTYNQNLFQCSKFYRIKPETLSRATGVCDIDGIEIFENDIVEKFCCHCVYQQIGNYPPPNVEVEEWAIERSVHIVEYSYGSFNIDGYPLMFETMICSEEDDKSDIDNIIDDEMKYQFNSLWEDNYNNIQDKYPYLTYKHLFQPRIIGNKFDHPYLLH